MPDSTVPGLPSATPLTGSELLYAVQNGLDRKITAGQIISNLSRLHLFADATYYVSTTGNDTTGDGSAGNPWQTLQHAVDQLDHHVDVANQTVIIQLQAGTVGTPAVYDGAVLKAFTGGGSVAIETSDGNTATTTLGYIRCESDTTVHISVGGMTLVGDISITACIKILGDITLYTGTTNCPTIKFAPSNTAWYCIWMQDHSTFHDEVSTTEIATSCRGYILAENFSTCFVLATNYVLTGTPAWGDAFFALTQGSMIQSQMAIGSGSATGNRFSMDKTATILFHIGAVTNIPGDVTPILFNGFISYGTPLVTSYFNPITSSSSIGGLPTPSAANTYARMIVTDASSTPTFNGIVSGSSSTVAPVWCDGTNWRYG